MDQTADGVSFSVLTPCMNAASFIGDARDSLARQGMMIQHVVQDALSGDATLELLRSQQHRSSLIDLDIVSGPDSGQSDALNKALARATGNWIGWLNGDEFYLPGAMDAVSRVVTASGADVVVGDCVLVDGKGRVLRVKPSHNFSWRALTGFGCYIQSCATFVRSSVLSDIGFDVTMRRAMDWDLYLTLGRRAKFAYVPRVLAAFRIHDEQVTARPEHLDREEFSRLAAKHGLRSVPVGGSKFSGGAFEHVALKALSGGYRRQLRGRAYRGQSVRWWNGDAEYEVAKALTKLGARR